MHLAIPFSVNKISLTPLTPVSQVVEGVKDVLAGGSEFLKKPISTPEVKFLLTR